MRIPYAVWGMFLLPILVGFIFVIKAFCGGAACFADSFAKAIFLPLIAMSNIFGRVPTMNGAEIAFVFLYWALLGFLVGFILDLCTRRSPYSPVLRPPL